MLIMLLVSRSSCDIPKVYAAQVIAQLLSGTQPCQIYCLVFLQCQHDYSLYAGKGVDLLAGWAGYAGGQQGSFVLGMREVAS